MKKINLKTLLISTALLGFNVLAFLPVVLQVNHVNAAITCEANLVPDPDTGLCIRPSTTNSGPIGARTVTELVVSIIDILLGLAAIIAIGFIVIGGYRYITSAGNEEGAKAGRQTLTNAIIGLVIIILAYMIVRVVNNTVAGGPAY